MIKWKPTLFDSFKRTEGAVAGKQKGWGLGLALVKGLVEAHGGSLGVKSDETSGTTFWVKLPIDCRSAGL